LAECAPNKAASRRRNDRRHLERRFIFNDRSNITVSQKILRALERGPVTVEDILKQT
jgi:hypothetical protein